jgi:hypothetical protein
VLDGRNGNRLRLLAGGLLGLIGCLADAHGTAQRNGSQQTNGGKSEGVSHEKDS